MLTSQLNGEFDNLIKYLYVSGRTPEHDLPPDASVQPTEPAGDHEAGQRGLGPGRPHQRHGGPLGPPAGRPRPQQDQALHHPLRDARRPGEHPLRCPHGGDAGLY